MECLLFISIFHFLSVRSLFRDLSFEREIRSVLFGDLFVLSFIRSPIHSAS
jgi:hypothetical protein